ncbi:MAG: OmpA family protein [Bacteroidaceae bacterium]|nr:OmpA family protein [Bacteroidaceae bacterium]
MKKLLMIAAVAVFALNASAADGFKSTKPLDNTYISLQGGVYEPLTGQNILKDARPVVRLSVNKFFNTVIGASIWGQAYINNNNYNDKSNYPFYNYSWLNERGNKTMFDGLNVGISGLVNLNNLFAGYAGAPRFFEVIAEAGVGYFHQFGAQWWNPSTGLLEDVNNWRNVAHSTINLALNCNFNINNKWQINLRPEVQYLENVTHMDANKAQVQLTAGVAYNLGDVFTPIVPRSQEEIDGLNGQINSLKGQLANKDNVIAAKNKEIEALKNRPVEKVRDVTNVISNAATNVFFKINSAKIADPKDFVNLDAVAAAAIKSGSRVVIMGTADSKTGSAKINQKLSDARANAAKEYLISKGVAADMITTAGEGGVDTLQPFNLNRRALVELK